MSPGDPIVIRGLEVSLRQGEDGERLIRRFLKKVRNDGILREYRMRTSFVKPSAKRRRGPGKRREKTQNRG
jgi:ribosomal protein S21